MRGDQQMDILCVGGNLVSWKSKKQTVMSKSRAESE